MLPEPVDGLVREGGIDGGVATVENKIKRNIEVIGNRLQSWKISMNV